MDWADLFFKLFWFVLPLIISWFAGKYIKTEEERKRWQLFATKAYELVLAAKDLFPDGAGKQKLAWVMENLKTALIKAGYFISDEEAEALARAAYQKMKAEVVKG